MSTEKIERWTYDQLEEAAKQLEKSERGKKALANFCRLTQEGASGLDYANARALMRLLHAMLHNPWDLPARLTTRPEEIHTGSPGQPLRYNAESRRFVIGESELHCGDVIQLDACGTWIETRIEHSESQGGWYFVHVSPNSAAAWAGRSARRAA